MSAAPPLLLDTNAAIAIIRGRPPQVRDRLRRARADGRTLVVSSVTLYELWYGVARSGRVAENTARLEAFLAGDVEVVEFDAAHAAEAGGVRARLEAAGTPIGPYDLLLAGQALAMGATLVTANVGEFARVAGLAWEDWTADV